MDVQGPEKARPYLAKAKATFPTLVDEENQLGQVFGFKVIPNGLLIDEQGVIRYLREGGFDIRKPETAAIVGQWAEGSDLKDVEHTVGPSSDGRAGHGGDTKAMRRFREGIEVYREGRPQEAVALWREGLAFEPDNLIVRKQIWAVENPDRFYDGAVDYGWQREQIEAGR